MEQSDLDNFTEVLVNCTSQDEDIRNRSTDIVLNLKSQDLFGFLNALLCVIQNKSTNQSAMNLALILSYRTFQEIEVPDSTTFKFQYIESNSPSLLKNYLSASSELLETVPDHAANLFSCITSIICLCNEDSNILQELLSRLDIKNERLTVEIFHVVYNITNEFALEPELYQPILTIIFTLFGEESNFKIKSLALKILSNMIDKISDVFENQQNLESFTNVLTNSINEFELKSSGYKCISQIINYNFPAFVPLADEAISKSVVDLEENSDDEQIIISILDMYKKLTKNKNDKYDEARKEVLVQAFPSYFGSFIKIAMNHNDVPDEPDTFNSSCFAYQVIARIIRSIPDTALTPAFEFAQNNVQTQQDELKEVSLILFSYIVFYNHNNELVTGLLQLFPEILNENNSRVKDSALSLLQVIIDYYFDDFKDQIFSYSPVLLEMLGKETDSPLVAAQICVTLSKYKKLPNFKDVVFAMLTYTNTNSNIFASFLFESIAQIITKNTFLKYDDLLETLPHFIQVLKSAMAEQEYHQNLSYILYIFGIEILKCKESSTQFLSELQPLITQYYSQSEDPEAVKCLACFAEATKEHYSEHLPELIEILLHISERSDSNPHLFAMAFALLALKKCNLDLSPFLPNFVEAIMGILQKRSKDLTIWSEFLSVFTEYFKNADYFEKLSKIEGFIVYLIRAVTEVVSILDSVVNEDKKDDERDKFISIVCEFMNVLYSSVGHQESNQSSWFELGCRIFDSAAKYIELDYEFEENHPINIYSDLIYNLYQINRDFSGQFLSQSQESQEFLSELMEFECCKDSLNEVMNIMKSQQEE